jgi:hypothetical protein
MQTTTEGNGIGFVLIGKMAMGICLNGLVNDLYIALSITQQCLQAMYDSQNGLLLNMFWFSQLMLS